MLEAISETVARYRREIEAAHEDQQEGAMDRPEEDDKAPFASGKIKVKGVGVIRAHEAINCLIGFQKTTLYGSAASKS